MAQFEIQEILIAVGITVGVVLGLTIFACQTKYDFTGLGPYLFGVLITLFLFGIVLIFIEETREVEIIYASIGVVLFSLYLVYDTQLIIGGGHQYEFDVDDAVFAALNLYIDILNLIIFILILVGGGDS